MTGEWPNGEVDHKNGSRSDNRWSNLRLATHGQNAINSKLKSHNTSGHKGVIFDKTRGKWRAEIKCDGKRYNLGRFDSLEDAAKAYRLKALEIHGDFIRLE